MRLHLMPIAWVALFLLAGCDGADSRDELIQSGKKFAIVNEFTTLFPESIHSLANVKNGNATWVSKAPIQGQFILTMEIPVTIESGTVKATGEASFLLVEVTKVEDLGGGQTKISYDRRQLRFGKVEWQRLVKEKGDLRALDITFQKRDVPGFKEHWHAG